MIDKKKKIAWWMDSGVVVSEETQQVLDLMPDNVPDNYKSAINNFINTLVGADPSSGSFVINLSAAATAETSIGFFVLNR